MAGRNSHIEMNKVMVGDVVCIGISGEQSRTGTALMSRNQA